MVFRDSTGKELASIDGNAWHVKGGWDYNNNDDTLEVVNEYKEPYLQVRVLPDRIQLRGTLFNKNGFGVEISSMKHPDGEITGTLGWYVPGRPQKWTYPRLFRYPRGEFYGELEPVHQEPTVRQEFLEWAKKNGVAEKVDSQE